MRPLFWLTGILVAMSLGLLALLSSGCVLVYAPAAREASLYQHRQEAAQMTVNQDIPIEPRVANEVAGLVGAQVSGNSMTGVQAPKVKGLR